MRGNGESAAAIVLVLCCGLGAGVAWTADEKTPAPDAQKTRQDADAPALGMMVATKGDQPTIAVDGVRIAGKKGAVTATDAWHWGSITKSMTATLVARLVEQEVVAWDDTVQARLGKAVPDMRAEFHQATFRHLLSHRAGLAGNIPVARFADFEQHPEDPIADRLRWVKIALAQEPVGALGEKYEYSNNGFIVAGAMLEAATGKPWEALMQREVFAPLGIEGAGFGAPGASAPRGHTTVGGADSPAPEDTDNPAALGPAGRVFMPLADMARYLSAHAQRKTDFLGLESWAVLHTQPFGGNYAMGWVVTSTEGRWHNGSNTLWYAEAAFNLENGKVAAVAVNDGNIEAVQPSVRALLRALMQAD